MMGKYFLLVFSCFLATQASSQSEVYVKPKYKLQHHFDFAASKGEKEGALALSWSHFHGFGKKQQKFKVGYGLRFTSYVGANKLYTTAPSRLTSTQQGLGTLFSETINEKHRYGCYTNTPG